jgi:hypothetical protein
MLCSAQEGRETALLELRARTEMMYNSFIASLEARRDAQFNSDTLDTRYAQRVNPQPVPR